MRSALATVALLAVAFPLQASVELREALRELAGEVKKALDGKGASEVAIGKFDGPPSDKTAAGPGFTVILAEELDKLKVTVREQAKFGIEGRYHLTNVPPSNPDDVRLKREILAVKVKLEIIDAFDNRDKVDFERKVIKQSERVVRGEAALVRAFGGTMPLDPKNTELENDAKLRDRLIRQVTCHLDGTLIASASGQPYAMEILVRGKAREAKPKDGLAFVQINRDEVYAIRLYNRSEHEAAVQLFIDGISIFAFSELKAKDEARKGEPLYTAVIVPPAKDGVPGTALVEGWHRNNEKGGQDSFVITEYSKSAAGRLKRTEGLGTITATFQAAWEGDTAPKDEPGKRRGGLGDATGFGPPAGEGFQEVKRNFGVIRDCISVRYRIDSGK